MSMLKSNPKIAESSSDLLMSSTISSLNPDESSSKVSLKKKRYDKAPAGASATGATAAQGMIDSDDEYDGKCYVLDDREPGDVPESDFLKFMQRSRRSTADKDIVLDMEDEGDLPIEDDALASTAASVVAAATAESPYYYEGEGGAGEAGAGGEGWSYVDEDPMRSYQIATSSEAAGEDITKFRRVSASSSEAGAATSSSSITSSIRSSQLGQPTTFSTFGSSTSYWSAFPSSEKYALFGLSHTTSPGAPILYATAGSSAGAGPSVTSAAIATSSTVSSKLPEKQPPTVSKTKTVAAEKSDKKPVIVSSDKKAIVDKKPSSDRKTGKAHKYEIPKFTGKKTSKSTASGAVKTTSAELLVERMSSKSKRV